MNFSWVRDGDIIAPEGIPMAIDAHNYQMTDLNLEQASLTDEGQYQCALMVGGNINLLSDHIQLLLTGMVLGINKVI